jgi:hypothetical protein
MQEFRSKFSLTIHRKCTEGEFPLINIHLGIKVICENCMNMNGTQQFRSFTLSVFKDGWIKDGWTKDGWI